jgi:hypothetical protein
MDVLETRARGEVPANIVADAARREVAGDSIDLPSRPVAEGRGPLLQPPCAVRAVDDRPRKGELRAQVAPGVVGDQEVFLGEELLEERP